MINSLPYKFNHFFYYRQFPLTTASTREYQTRRTMHERVQIQSTSEHGSRDEEVEMD